MAQNTIKSNWLKDLYPGYFSLTMATGIIAIALEMLEMPLFSDVMCYIALASWVILFAINIFRLIRFPRALWADLTNPRKTFNFFTFVAATNIAGLVLNLHGYFQLALLCWIVAFLAWAVLMYLSFSVLTLNHGERNVQIVDGGWLIGIVGTESLVLLGVKIIPELDQYTVFLMLSIHMLWGLGVILYCIFVTLFCYRIFFMKMSYEDYTPQMWVIMGAAAITTNASSGLDMAEPGIFVLYEIHSAIDSVALLTWTWATWWIPLLVIISIWKHIVHKIPLRYDPRQWSIVFPLGMYTVATYQLSLAAEVEPLHQISHVMVWVAITVWALAMIALLRRITAGLVKVKGS
jgi:tellurite resistance protein TehA-like permease